MLNPRNNACKMMHFCSEKNKFDAVCTNKKNHNFIKEEKEKTSKNTINKITYSIEDYGNAGCGQI